MKIRDSRQPTVRLKPAPRSKVSQARPEGFVAGSRDKDWAAQNKLRSLAQAEPTGKKKKSGFWNRMLSRTQKVAAAVTEGLTKAVGLATAIVGLMGALGLSFA